jgi:poly(A) polymerase
MTAPHPSRLADHLPLLRAAAEAAARRGQEVWLCGGTLRDLLLGLDPPDVDLAAGGDALALGRELAERAGGRFVPLDEAHATCRVAAAGRWLDLAGLRAPDLAADLAARDFTVNALAWELADFLAGRGGIIDPTGGRADLAAGRLAPAGPGVLAADPLRVLRGFRFISTHGLEPDPDTRRRLAAAAPGLAGVAAERVGHEWLALMAGDGAARAVAGLDQAGALSVLVPELEAGRGLEQNPYHHRDVLGHSLETLQALAGLAAQPEGLLGGLAGEVSAYLAEPRRRALAFTAALLHDLGKPPTRQERGPGWATFYRHEIEGAGLAAAVCRRLGLSKADAGRVARLVGLHMRPFHLLGAWRTGGLTTRAVRRLLAAAGPELPGLMALAMADTIAGRGPQRPPQAEEEVAALFRRVAELRDRELAAALAAPPLVDGREVMAAAGVEEGPLVGRILAELREAQLEGQATTREEALELARRLGRELAGK